MNWPRFSVALHNFGHSMFALLLSWWTRKKVRCPFAYLRPRQLIVEKNSIKLRRLASTGRSWDHRGIPNLEFLVMQWSYELSSQTNRWSYRQLKTSSGCRWILRRTNWVERVNRPGRGNSEILFTESAPTPLFSRNARDACDAFRINSSQR